MPDLAEPALLAGLSPLLAILLLLNYLSICANSNQNLLTY
jgi:hypothetical protein